MGLGRGKRVWAARSTVAGLVLGLGVSGAGLAAQGPAASAVAARRGGGPPPIRRSGSPRLDSQLAQVAAAAKAHGSSSALEAAQQRKIAVDRGRVRVIVDADPGRVDASKAAVVAAGGTVEAQIEGRLEVLVPPDALAQLAASGAVAQVRSPAVPYPQAVDEGVTASRANEWQAAGFDGAGVKVAVVDTGFSGYAALLGTALPTSVTTIDHCSGQFSASPDDGGTDHGTAVAEIVHQMAPAAQLVLICIDNEVALAQAEHDVIDDGVQIVNHSLAWYDTSRGDGTGQAGTPDAIVADARAHGVLWVNAAGNDQQDHWSGLFTTSGTPNVNSFGGGDVTNSISILSGEQACVFLKWDDWPATTEDYDLELVNSGGGVVAFSDNDQADYPQQPTEYLCYTNPGATATFGIEIVRFSVVGRPRLDLYYTGSSPLEYATSGGVIEPASSPAAVAVGAWCWQQSKVESYSAWGTTLDGRDKPDLVALDGVSTETYDPADPSAACGSTGFPGTSASSPQVAGAAALVLERSPTLGVDGLEAAIEQTTLTAAGSGASSPGLDRGNGILSLGPVPSPGTVSPPSAVAPPTLTGTAMVGKYLAAGPGHWSASLGETLTFAWARCDANGANCAALASPTGSIYPLGADDVGSRIRVTVTATTSGGGASASTLASTTVVEAAPTPSVPPTFSGNAISGQTLSLVSNGGWNGSPTFIDQWRRCDADGSNCADIPGANAASYTLTSDDLGHVVRLSVSATNGGGTTYAASPGSAVVAGGSGGGVSFFHVLADAGSRYTPNTEQRYDPGQPGVALTATLNSPSLITISAATWSAVFYSADAPLQAGGFYPGATRYLGPSSSNGIDVIHGSEGCNEERGFFHIRQLTLGAGNSITSFDVVFQDSCDNTAPVHGEFAYNATGVSESTFTPDLVVYETASDGIRGTVVVTARLVNRGPVDSGDVSFAQDVGSTQVVSVDFSQRSGTCDGSIACSLRPVASGGVTYVTMVLKPSSTGILTGRATISAPADYDSANNSTGFAWQAFVPEPPATALLAFQSYRDGIPAIYTMSGSAAGQSSLVPAPFESFAPVWSPDGTRVAFDRIDMFGGDDIYVVDADGANLAHVTAGGHAENPAWAPSGGQIVYDVDGMLWVINLDGTGGRMLATGTLYAFEPTVSPDGAEVVFAATSNGATHLWKTRFDGSGSPTQLTFGNGADVEPKWAPDGRHVAFTSTRSGNRDVWVLDVQNSSVVDLTASDEDVDEYPAWSPDGSMIAFDSDRADPGGATDIYTMSADGSNVVRLAYDPGAILPSWRPPSPPSPPVAFSPPAISGTGGVGLQISTETLGSWLGVPHPTVSRQWDLCSSAANTSSCVDIPGQAFTQYAPVASDDGFYVRLKVTGVNTLGSAVAWSNAIFVSAKRDFTIEFLNTSLAVVAGDSASAAIQKTPIGGFDDPVTFTTLSAPPAATVTFIPNAATPVGVTIHTSATTPAGTYAVTIQASSGTLVHTATMTLTVFGGGPSPGRPPTGGGGGGGGSSSFTVSVTPSSQTVASGGPASWTIAVTNTGGAYLYAVGVSSPVPSCGIPAAFADTASLMPPGVTISYACSLSGLTTGMTNSVTATATTGPGDVLTATAAGVVTVQGSAPVPVSIGGGSTPSVGTSKPVATRLVTIVGTNGADHRTGTAKADVIRGLGGNDVLNGGRGNDTIEGGAGNDVLSGGPGKDNLRGGPGNDTIRAKDGEKDRVDCGPGRDIVFADKIDTVARNCETVHRG